jgi:phosphoribosylglycinamide formyltransferase-1
VIEAHEEQLLASRVAFVLTDRPSEIEAFVEERAIPHQRIAPGDCGSAAGYQAALKEALASASIDWLGMTFNRLLYPSVIGVTEGRVFNLHMSLLPAFPGFFPIKRALEAGVAVAGATVHLVDEGMDTGPILAQVTCPVLEADTEASLGVRLFRAILPSVLQVVRHAERAELIVRDEGLLHRASGLGKALELTVDGDIDAFCAAFCSRMGLSAA